MTTWNCQTLRCECHFADCCPDVESEYSAIQAEEEWDKTPEMQQQAIMAFNAAWELARSGFWSVFAPNIEF